MFKLFIKGIITFFISISLTACLSLGGLTHKQAKMLKNEGFTLTEEGWTLGLPEKLLFDFDTFNIATPQQTELKQLSEQLLKYDLQKLKIIGHTDNVGDIHYNITLSKKRAERVKEIFIEEGFKENNIQTVGRGPSQPLVENNSEENRAINRRVNLIILP